MLLGSVKSTGYPLHSPDSPSLPHPCVTTFQLDSTTSKKLLTTDTARQHVALCLKRQLITSLVKIGPDSKAELETRAHIYMFSVLRGESWLEDVENP